MKNKLAFVSLIMTVLFFTSVSASTDVKDYLSSDYLEDNYQRYKDEGYDPVYRPYSIAGTLPLRIYLKNEEGSALAIPEFIPKSRYEKKDFVPREYDTDYYFEPFHSRKSSSIAVRYVNIPKKPEQTSARVQIILNLI